MKFEFGTYKEFLDEYERYEMDKCNKCGCKREILVQNVEVVIDERKMFFKELFLLSCTNCNTQCLPEYSKQMIDGCYKTMVKEGQFVGEFIPKKYIKKFDYCSEMNYTYDHRDYYNIPGLCYDDEHSIEGFLTPVYFERKALIYFVSDPDFVVDIFSETYGHIGKKDKSGVYQYEWDVPFGFNSNGKLIFWLGDISYMDTQSQAILKSFNVESDHLIIDSEFFQAQMNCIFSQPIKEKQILHNKDNFISNINKKYNIDLSHLDDECSIHAKNINRPLVFTEQSVSGVINAFDKILVEGFDVERLRELYVHLYHDEVDEQYKKWQSIRLIKEILLKLNSESGNSIDIETMISPLYILHDYRIYLDHLLSNDKREEIREHIVSTLGLSDFTQQEEIYIRIIERLNRLFQCLVLLSNN